MSRKPGHDNIKLETIIYALKTSPHGSWVRDIAKKTGLKKSTVAHYINNHLKDKIEVVHDSKHIRIIKLKHLIDEKNTGYGVKPADEFQTEQKVEHQPEMEEVPNYIG